MRILKKTKAALIKTISKAKSKLKLKPKKAKTPPVKAAKKRQQAKEASGTYETAIVNTKFSHSQEVYQAPARPQELPSSYNLDRMVLQVRDPRWLHTYWEVKEETFQGFKSRLGDDFFRAKRVLRVYDVTNIIFNGSNANRFFDIQINDFANSWYVDTAGPGRAWCVDLGLMLPDGRFITILRSNVVQTPLDSPSWITDEEWMVPDEIFARLYGMGFGLGKSSPVGGAWQERVKQGLFSSGLSSSPVKKAVKERSFWLKVDCELIVYGATEPDAQVTVQGMPIKLRPDGTFTLRYYLPDGRQVIPVKAKSADNVDERVITPIVTRETK
ncbi:MAG: DUF4912 domain-containing protein [Candidatus Omnitrophica bacterium]|jgi:hypothetical protein|nr:DUF4912 domain-containing protein [Candidatus Omnitrophota bacterium]MDD3274264.1 DUF4912 domain-containing protein [Candidatus Omnitrophota bacterium]MDD5077479.1 DUF4912 domain-containing protein [Candidatus Omnitrophota bacterium]